MANEKITGRPTSGVNEPSQRASRAMKISDEAIEMLRRAAVPEPFNDLVHEMLPRTCCEELPGARAISAVRPTAIASAMPWAREMAFWAGNTFHLTDMRLDLSAVSHRTPGLQELASAPLSPLIYNQLSCWAPQAASESSKDEEDIETLVKRINDLPRFVQALRGLAEALQREGLDEWIRKFIIEYLVRLLGHKEWPVRAAADTALRRLSEFGPSIVNDLRGARDATEDPEIRERLRIIVADSAEEEVEDLLQHTFDIPVGAPQTLHEEADADLQEAKDDLEAARRDTTGAGVEERRGRREARARRLKARKDAIEDYKQSLYGPPR